MSVTLRFRVNLESVANALDLGIGEVLDPDELVARIAHRPDQLIELEVDGFGVAVLGVLDHEHDEERDDRRPGRHHVRAAGTAALVGLRRNVQADENGLFTVAGLPRGEMWVEDETRKIEWEGPEDVTQVELHYSVDGGQTWKKLTAGLPKLVGRIGVKVAPARTSPYTAGLTK